MNDPRVASSPIARALADACERARRGDFAALERARAEARPDEPACRVWLALGDALRWFAGLTSTTAPQPHTLEQLLPAPEPAAASELAARTTAAATLRLDPDGSVAAADLTDRIAQSTDDPTAPLWSTLAAAFAALATGRDLDDAKLVDLEHAARKRQAADLVVDAASVRALIQARRGALDEALESARRAWRMARTERLPQSQYLAGATLARLRRLEGSPYLATRIASALAEIVSPPWRTWVDWEHAMASGRAPTHDADTPAAALTHLLQSATDGDRSAFEDATASLHAATSGFALMRRDVERLLAVVDPNKPPSSTHPDLHAWIEGAPDTSTPPFGLAGLNGLEDATAQASALVLAIPDQPGRRLLRVATGLVTTHTQDRFVPDDHAGRPESLLSALALAGPAGLPDDALFRSVYGFRYVASRHRGTFDVALHRARTRLGELGHIERGDGHMRLHVDAPLWVVDPRTRAPIDDRVLALVARHAGVSARDAAQSLSVPLRTIQASLRKLVDDGACLQQRDGRRVVYAVEDTTFQEPTLPGRASTSPGV